MNSKNYLHSNPQELVQLFLDMNEDGFFAFDLDCKFTYWSASLEKISGISAYEVLGRNAFEYLAFLKETGVDQLFQKTLQGETPTSKAQVFKFPESGKKGYYDAQYFPVQSAGKVTGGIAIIKEITKQKEAADLNAEIENRFKNMADSSPVLLWMSGLDGMCNFFNQTWLNFTGRTLEQEWGVGWAENVHYEDFQPCMDTYLKAFNERKEFEMEYRLQRADGQYRWILDRGVPRYTPTGQFTGYIGSCVDITERKELEVDLLKAIQVREEFLSIASHELKTPLTSINLHMGIIETLFKKTTDLNSVSEKLKNLLDVSHRQLRHMTDLIERLLDLSRASISRTELHREESELGVLVDEIAARFKFAAEQAKCELQLSIEKDIIGQWDRSRLDQVITNLFTNSLKYAPGKPVEVKVYRKENTAIIDIMDNGPGIPEESRSKIFEKYHRANATKNQAGLGLGLYIAKEIIDSHGGAIKALPPKKAGAFVRVELPLSSSG